MLVIIFAYITNVVRLARQSTFHCRVGKLRQSCTRASNGGQRTTVLDIEEHAGTMIPADRTRVELWKYEYLDVLFGMNTSEHEGRMRVK